MRRLSFVCTAAVLLQTLPLSAVFASTAGQGSASPPGAATQNLNLSSTAKSLSAGALGITAPLNIAVGGSTMHVLPTTSLTPAEYLAASQVISGGAQSIQLGATGAAVGGAFALTGATAANVGNLSVPANVRMVENFSALNALNLAGNLTNAGSIFAYSTTPLNAATINAANIYNQQSGLITTVLSTPGFGSTVSNAVPNLALTLDASGTMVNQGKITSAGDLNIVSANVTNGGTLSSLGGNVNFSAPAASGAGSAAPSITINNTGGVIQASLGDINVRDASFTGNANVTLTGGVASANDVNIYSGGGTVNVDMEQINGTVNVTANSAHVTTNGGTLTLGNMNLAGDPTYYNSDGGIQVVGAVVTSGNALALVASGDVTSQAGSSISTSGSGIGGDLTVVAGANFSLTPNNASSNTGTDTSGAGDTTTVLTIQGPSASGGSINLTNVSSITTTGTSGGSGGNVTMVAYQSAGNGGSISTNASAGIASGGNGTAANGSVTMVAPNGISTGTIDTTGGTGGGGNVLLSTAQPAISGGTSNTISISNGAILAGSGSFVPSTTTPTTGSVSAQNISVSGSASITVQSANSSSLGNLNGSSGPINVTIGGANANLSANTVGTSAGSVNINVINGPANLQSVFTSSGNVSINSSNTTVQSIIGTDAGNVTISGGGISMTTADILTTTGSINLNDTSGLGITVNSMATEGGAITAVTNGNFTVNGAVIAAGSTTGPFGNIAINASQGIVSIGGTGGSYAGTNSYSVVGNSILITTNSEIVKPTAASTALNWTATSDLVLGGAMFIKAPVQLNQSTAGPLVLTAFSTPASDYVAVSGGNISAAKAITINTASTTVGGLGGQVLIIAGAAFSTSLNTVGFPTGFLAINTMASSSTGGNVNLAGSSITTNGGATVTIQAYPSSSSGNPGPGNIQFGNITAGDGGTINLYAPSGGIYLSGTLSAPGSASNPNGGTIILTAGQVGTTGTTPVTLSANAMSGATGTGNGGSIFINLFTQTTPFYIGSGPSQFNVFANGGTAGGNGGSLSVSSTSTGDINVDSNYVSLNASQAASSNGGTILLQTNGNINLTTSGSSPFNLSAGNNGGNFAAYSGNGNINISASIYTNGGGTGAGGDITLNANQGQLNLNSGSNGLFLQANSGNVGGGSGGSITLVSNSPLAVNGLVVAIDANGEGYGNGGLISITSYALSSNLSIGYQLGQISLSACGGVNGSNAGDGGNIYLYSGGGISVDVTAVSFSPLGTNGNGGNITLLANQGGSVGALNIYSSFSSGGTLYANGAGIGNGGNITVMDNFVAEVTPPPIQVSVSLSANGGNISGNGGNISFYQSFSHNGVQLLGSGDPEIDFTGALSISANAPTQGSGGSIVLWGDKLVVAGGPVALSATGNAPNDITPGNGGYIALITNNASGDINIGGGANAFTINATGISAISATTGTTGTANGGSVQLWATGGGNINVDANPNYFNVAPSGVQGNASLVSFSTIPGGGSTYTASGPFPLDTYGGGITITNSEGSSSSLANNSIGGSNTPAGFYIQANSFSPITISSNFNLDSTNDTSLPQSLYISNLGPGGVSLAGGILLSSSGPQGDLASQGGTINISTSHIVITGNNGPATINALGAAPDGNVAIFTTDPSPSGDLTIGSGNQSLVVQNNWFNGGTGGNVTVSAGGNLTVQGTFPGLSVGADTLVLSAGLYPANLTIVGNGGPAIYTSPVPNDATKSNYGNLVIQLGKIGQNATAPNPGMQIFLLSNSANTFAVGSTSFNANGQMNGVGGAVVATTSGSVMGNIVIANFGTGGITLDDPSVLQVASPATAGGSTGTALPAPFAVPLPNGNPSTGIIELYTPAGVLTTGAGTFSAATSAAGAQGGYIYVNASDITVAGGGQLNFIASSQTGNGGGVAIITQASTSNLVVGSGNLTIFTNGYQAGSGPPGSGSGGPVSVVAGGNLTVDPTVMNVDGNGSSFNGASINLAATTGTLFINGSLNPFGLGSGSAGGSVTLSWGSSALFQVGGTTSNGISGSIDTAGGSGGPGGAITLNYLGTAFSSGLQINTALGSAGSQLNVTALNTSSTLYMTISTSPAATLNVTTQDLNVSATGSLTVGNLIAYNGSVVVATSGSLSVAPSSNVFAENGIIELSTSDTTGGSSINIGANALISASSGTPGAADVNIFIGPYPSSFTATPPIPSNITVHTDNTFLTGAAYFNPSGSTAPINGPASATPATTVNADDSPVLFNNAATSGVGAINIGQGSTIQSVYFPSLDLDNMSNGTYVHNLISQGVLSGTYQYSVSSQSGTVVIPQNISTRNLSGLDVPTGVILQFNDLNNYTPVNVNISNSSTTLAVIVMGEVLISSSSPTATSNATINITQTASPVIQELVSISNSGSITNNTPSGSITLNAAGSLVLYGAITAPNSATVTTTAGSGGNMTIFGAITSNSISLSADGAGGISTSGGGSITASTISLTSGTGIVGNAGFTLTNTSGSPLILSVNTGGSAFIDTNSAFAPTQLAGINVGPSQTFRLTASGSISQGVGTATAGTLDLITDNGYIGTPATPILTNVPTNAPSNTITVQAATGGGPFPVGSIGISDSSGKATFSTVSTAGSQDILLRETGFQTLTLAGNVTTNGGNITIQSTDSNGAIVIGNFAQIVSLSQTLSPSILFSIDGAAGQGNPNPPNPPISNLVAVNSPGSNIYFNNGFVGGFGSMSVFALGNQGSTVTFGGTGLGIKVGVNVVVATGNTSITSLDLATDANTATNIAAMQQAGTVLPITANLPGGSLILTNGVATSGTLTLQPGNITGTLSALNIPAGVDVTLNGLSSLNVALTNSSSTTSATINGNLAINSGSFQLNVSTTVTPATPALTIGALDFGANPPNGQLTSFGSLTIVTPSITNSGQVTGATLVVTSPAGQPLSVVGSSSGSAGSFFSQSQTAVFTSQSTTQPMTMSGSIALGGLTYLNSPGGLTLTGATVAAIGEVQVNSPSITDPQGLQANSVIFNSGSAPQGTIENPNGNVVLTSKLTFVGENLAIIASGNIMATSAVTTINLSNSKAATNSGNGGNLLLIAGFDFTSPGASSVTTPVSGTGTYTITGPSATGGSILLAGVSINTSSTTPGNGSTRGGSLTAEAEAGGTNSGVAEFGTITATSNNTNGIGGSIVINAGGGVMTKAISTAAANGGSVTISGSNPSIFGTVTISDAIINSSGAFAAGSPVPGSGSAINIAGTITTTGATQTAGSISLTADQQIVVTGAITATGLVNNVGTVAAGGQVECLSTEGSIATGAINVNGDSITSHSSNVLAGNGGSVDLFANTGVTVTGNITANGGNNAGTASAGNGGFVNITNGQDSSAAGSTAGAYLGNVKITGFVQDIGGTKTGGGGGNGGEMFMTGNAVAVLGSSGGISLNASPSGTGLNGMIQIDTFGVQTLTSNFDPTSTTKSEVALPGGMFTVGTASPVNGTAGTIQSKLASPVTKTNVNANHSGFVLSSGSQYNFSNVVILSIGGISTDTINSGAITINSNANSTGTRTTITPSEAIALFEGEHGQSTGELTVNPTTLVANSGSWTIGAAEGQLPATFGKFNLPFGFTLNVTGELPVMNLPSTAVLVGTLSFTEGGSTAFVNLGAGSTITALSGSKFGTISAADNLILSGTGGTWNNNGKITAGDEVIIARPSSGLLTINNIGSTADIQAPGGVVLSQTVDAGMSFTFQAKGSNFSSSIAFQNVIVPSMYTALAANLSKDMVTLPNVAIKEALAVPGGGQVTGGDIIGTLSGGTISITSVAVPLKVGASTITTATDINLDAGTILTASTKLTITSAGVLTIGDGDQLTGGVLAATAPTVGLLSSSAIVTAGSVSITSAGSSGLGGPGAISFGTGDTLTANGGNLTLTATNAASGSQLDTGGAGGANTFQANGGNVQLYAKTSVNAENNYYYARSTSKANAVGGGIEFGAGITTGGSLTTAFTKTAGTTVGTVPANVFNVNLNGGVVFTTSGTPIGTITATAATIQLSDHGAVGIDAVGSTGNAANVNLNGANISADAVKPVSNTTSAGTPDEFIVDTNADATDDGLCDQDATPLKMVMAK